MRAELRQCWLLMGVGVRQGLFEEGIFETFKKKWGSKPQENGDNTF